MEFKFFSKNGQILPIAGANISLQNLAYSYGFGVYESIKIRKGVLYFQKQHIERLFNSAGIIELEHTFDYAKISNYISDLVKEEKMESANLKIILLGGKTSLDSQLFIIPLAPLFPDRKYYTAGVGTITVQFERLFPNAKTLNMLGSYLAFKKAKAQDCYDALLVDPYGNINEGTRTNFFTIKDKTIFTQPSEKILEGVTRATVLHVAKKMGFVIKEKNVTPKDLTEVDCAFLTSTSSKIMPIKSIDDYVFASIPEALKSLMQEYDQFLKASNGIFNEIE